jgi:hypothetical protein
MRTFLILSGAAWLTLAWWMLLSLALVARWRMPLPALIPVNTRRLMLESGLPSESSPARERGSPEPQRVDRA